MSGPINVGDEIKDLGDVTLVGAGTANPNSFLSAKIAAGYDGASRIAGYDPARPMSLNLAAAGPVVSDVAEDLSLDIKPDLAASLTV